MKLYGITGGIGMGKSASARFLAEWGVPVIDTDALARQLVEPGQPALDEIRAAFGPAMIDDAGQLRRAALAATVFNSDALRRRLEAILHPRIRTAWQTEVGRWRQAGLPTGAVIIPLLFETKAESELDCVICVACLPATQRRRLRDRGWSEDEIDRRLAAQWPVHQKIERANRIVWTEPSLDIHAAQLARILGRPGMSASPR